MRSVHHSGAFVSEATVASESACVVVSVHNANLEFCTTSLLFGTATNFAYETIPQRYISATVRQPHGFEKGELFRCREIFTDQNVARLDSKILLHHDAIESFIEFYPCAIFGCDSRSILGVESGPKPLRL